MRSEKEMLDLIIDIATNDSRIRAAYLEGSRVNPNVPKDIFQDYDVEKIEIGLTISAIACICNIRRKIFIAHLMLIVVMGG